MKIHLAQNAGARRAGTFFSRAGTFFDVNSVRSSPGSQSETQPSRPGLAGDAELAWHGRLVSSRRPTSSPQAGSHSQAPDPAVQAGAMGLPGRPSCWASSAAWLRTSLRAGSLS
jgi:hypothetical protein